MSNISRGLVAEAFNDMFAKYGKPEIAPVNRKDGQGRPSYDRLPRNSWEIFQRANILERTNRNGSPRTGFAEIKGHNLRMKCGDFLA